MNTAQIAELLTFCAAFDRRTVGRSDAIAWHQVLGDLDADDARQAVADYYATTREWIMPSDIRKRVKDIRAARITAAHALYDGHPDETGAQSARSVRSLAAAAAAGQLPPRAIGAALDDPGAVPAPQLIRHLKGVGRTVEPALAPRPAGHGANPLAVPCPHCHADTGTPCRSRRRRRANAHPSRQDAAWIALTRHTA